jgi:ArsR family transcriptional regulator, arsenate/arsenite/antimonite-responsive transcriptional repressor
MTIQKESSFDEALMKRARLFKALAHPARLAILQYLAEIRTCITGDIADELPLGRTTVNQHLKELRDAGLIQGTVEGVKTNYCLNTMAIKSFHQDINAFFSQIDNNQTFC